MTALMGAAVLGLVPLPSMAIPDARAGRCDQRSTPSENANFAHPIFSLRAILEGAATSEGLARLRYAVGDTDAHTTRNAFRNPGSKQRLGTG